MSRRIGIASLIWGVSILLSRVIGLFREAAIGRILGGGGEADVYFLAFNVPDWLNYLLAGGALSIVFIPIFGRYLAEGDEERGWQAFSVVANFVLLLLAVFVPTLWLLLPALAPLYAPGLDGPALDELVELTRIMLPGQVFFVVGGLLSAALQAQDRHVLPALAPLVYNGSVIAGGVAGELLLGSTAGAHGFAWGVLAGSALGPFGLPLVGCLRVGLRWRMQFSLRHPDLRAYLVRSLPIMLAFSLIAWDDWLLRGVGSLLGEGSVATLQYAKQLMKVPMGVFGLAVGVASFPTVTRMLAEGRRLEAFDTLASATRRMLVLAFGAQVVFTVAGAQVAEVIYGGRIDAEQYAAIGQALAVMCLALWAWAAQTVVSRGFYADGNTWIPSVAGTAMMLLAAPLYYVFGQALGTTGLAVASSLGVSAYVMVLVVLLRRRYPGGQDRYGAFALRMLPAVAAGVGAGWALDRAVTLPGPLLSGAVLAVVGGAVYLGAALLLGAPEAREVLEMVTTRVRRRPRRNR